jgi:hypothetical protein
LSAITLVFNAIYARAYEVGTHEILSSRAAQDSVLKNAPETLHGLGLKSWNASETFPNSKGQPRTITQLFQEGARFEDNNIRPANHFYNPLTEQGITGFKPSPEWALEDNGDIDGQESSYKNARQYLYDALTAKSPTDHDRNFGKMFETLGHVVHHLQDMAQPQHVRNDPHCDAYVCRIVNRSNPGRYEKYTELPNVRDSLIGFERAGNCVHP